MVRGLVPMLRSAQMLTLTGLWHLCLHFHPIKNICAGAIRTYAAEAAGTCILMAKLQLDLEEAKRIEVEYKE